MYYDELTSSCCERKRAPCAICWAMSIFRADVIGALLATNAPCFCSKDFRSPFASYFVTRQHSVAAAEIRNSVMGQCYMAYIRGSLNKYPGIDIDRHSSGILSMLRDIFFSIFFQCIRASFISATTYIHLAIRCQRLMMTSTKQIVATHMRDVRWASSQCWCGSQ